MNYNKSDKQQKLSAPIFLVIAFLVVPNWRHIYYENSFVDLQAQYQNLKIEIDQAIQSVIKDTAFIRGKYVETFEQAFAKAYGVKHCISVANGTDAIYITLKMLCIGAGDE
jgi:hypothetical protein